MRATTWMTAVTSPLVLVAIALIVGHGTATAHAGPLTLDKGAVGLFAGGNAVAPPVDATTAGQGMKPAQLHRVSNYPLTLSLATATPTPTSTPFSAGEIEAAPIDEAMEIIEGADDAEVAQVFDEMSTDKVVDMMYDMEMSRAASIWSQMAPSKAGAVFDYYTTEAAIQCIKMVPEDRLIPRLPHVTPAKLWEIPLEFLMEQLPSVPVMHLDSWNRPVVAPDLPAPLEKVRDAFTTVYSLPEARESEWAVMANSQAPFDAIWAKFTRGLTDVSIRVESLLDRPPGTPGLPPGQVANSFFRIDLENAVPDDISVIAAIAFVEKTWIDANQIHRWSIQFNRFDEGLRTWVPFPSKRVREDAERVFFAVVLPGFSDLAITGSETLPEQTFSVTDLTIDPQRSRAGDRITISAYVTNNGGLQAVYPADLWVNNSIVDTQALTLDAGEQAAFSFTIIKPEGEYSVRVERELAVFTVISADQPAAAPGVGGTGLTPKGLTALALAAAALVLGGVYLTLARPQGSGGGQ